MKKTFWGFVFLIFAACILINPNFGIPFWPLVFIIGFGICAIQELLRKDYTGAYICGVITFIILENQFDWFDIGTGTMVMAAVLAGIGLSLIFKPRDNVIRDNLFYNGFKSSSVGADTVFGNTTRYINDSNFIDVGGDAVFSRVSIYFDNAIILGDKATYSGDAVFSNVRLYVPKNWKVEFTGDRVFSTVPVYPNTEPTETTLVVTGDFFFSRLEVYYI